MIKRSSDLLNATLVDAMPAGLITARRSADARQVSRSHAVLRRKIDGRFIATLAQHDGGALLHPLDACTDDDIAAIAQLLALLGLTSVGPLHPRKPTALRELCRRPRPQRFADASLRSLHSHLADLALDPGDYRRATGLPMIAEPWVLAAAGRDRYGRPLWLIAGAARAWLAMRAAAAIDGVALDAISGFRSHAYQVGIVRRKLARGQTMAQILAVNAAPGFSEHHSGRALDIGSVDEPPAEESFESTAAFDWLRRHASGFGFRMSYPRGNPHGIVYEPWHWFWAGPG